MYIVYICKQLKIEFSFQQNALSYHFTQLHSSSLVRLRILAVRLIAVITVLALVGGMMIPVRVPHQIIIVIAFGVAVSIATRILLLLLRELLWPHTVLLELFDMLRRQNAHNFGLDFVAFVDGLDQYEIAALHPHILSEFRGHRGEKCLAGILVGRFDLVQIIAATTTYAHNLLIFQRMVEVVEIHLFHDMLALRHFRHVAEGFVVCG